MKLLIQPGDGIKRLVKGIRKAKDRVEIMIFRFDRSEIERALIDAVERGVFVHALIAFTNRGGEEHLRKLEKDFLANGITVARTAGDLVRYHGKMMIVDRKELYVNGFNFTHLDIDRSRSFGLITRNPKLVAEAAKLFEADTKRQAYTAGNSKFLVSPVNARKQLAGFIKGAKRELLIYDPKISDRAMLRLLQERKKAGIDIRIIGCVSGNRLPACDLKRMRLHTRTIVRDRTHAFIGSQSLRQLELDARREIGIIFRDGAAIKDLIRTFEEDWAASSADIVEEKTSEGEAIRAVKKVAQAITKRVPLMPVAKKVLKTISNQTDVDFDHKQLHKEVTEILKDVVEKTAQEAAQEAAEVVVKAS
ncbi:MAG TPA: phospholipase D-like domain-containing protein [Terriglobales bacterium]|nr:phospholipase D-like domain-containing protein [Terriglobales bacterium]